MPYPIEQKLVIAVASSALFDLTESDAIYRTEGQEAYRLFQREHENDILRPGIAFPFIKRLLSLNERDADDPVEVILLSKNDADTGLRVFNSIVAHNLQISRAAFLNGSSPYTYIPAFDCCLFLSANESDVKEAIMANAPAGLVLGPGTCADDPADCELRIAFDFDGVLADDEAEKVYKATKDLKTYHESEKAKAHEALKPGPLHRLLEKIAQLQKRERDKKADDPQYEPLIRTAIITARNKPAHERLIHTLRAWGITVDECFFLGGMEKKRILAVFKPHIFFDDQKVHMDTSAGLVPCVHVPFGIANRDSENGAPKPDADGLCP